MSNIERPCWWRVPELDRATALSGAYASGFADGYRQFAEALDEARAERDQLKGAVATLVRLANPTHRPRSEEAWLLQAEVVQIAQATLDALGGSS